MSSKIDLKQKPVSRYKFLNGTKIFLLVLSQSKLEAPAGFEPANQGFADPSIRPL